METCQALGVEFGFFLATAVTLQFPEAALGWSGLTSVSPLPVSEGTPGMGRWALISPTRNFGGLLKVWGADSWSYVDQTSPWSMWEKGKDPSFEGKGAPQLRGLSSPHRPGDGSFGKALGV